jgi:chemotaxis protein CheX
MSTRFEEAIHQIVSSVWTSMLGLDVQPIATSDTPRTEGALVGTVRISGAWEGEVRLRCSSGLAHRVAGIMFAIDPTATTTAQAEDALGELANMTGGNLKALLPEPCQLSIPNVAAAGDSTAVGSRLLSAVSFECQGEPLQVMLLRALPVAA